LIRAKALFGESFQQLPVAGNKNPVQRRVGICRHASINL
jgi:hypothetical protein